MSDKILSVYLHNDRKRNCCAYLTLPATPYQLLDAVEKLRIQEGDKPTCTISSLCAFTYLFPVLPKDPNIYALNILAQRLTALSEAGKAVFESLVGMESGKNPGRIPLEQLVSMAQSAKGYCVISDVHTYTELGRHYVENGLFPLTNLPEKTKEFLDYEKLGQEICTRDKGNFTAQGYMIKVMDIQETVKDIDSTPLQPDYTILLELSQDNLAAHLKLPATYAEINQAMERIAARSWNSVDFRCLDCVAPFLVSSISDEDNIDHINRLAQQLKSMGAEEITKFKAILEATEDYTVPGASHIAYNLDDYLFTPQYTVPEDMARDFLSNSMGEIAMKAILPYLNLCGYGEALMRQQECTMTEYGMVSREDGQCLKTSLTPTAQPEMGGMTMQ